jgi:hypothetical protein
MFVILKFTSSDEQKVVIKVSLPSTKINGRAEVSIGVLSQKKKFL